MGTKYYRPYLSLDDIQEAIVLFSTSRYRRRDEVIKKLRRTLVNADAELTSAQYISTPRPTMEARLGAPAAPIDEESRYLSGDMSEDERNEYERRLLG